MKILIREKLVITAKRHDEIVHHIRTLNHFVFNYEMVSLLLYTLFIDITDIIKGHTLAWTPPPHMLYKFWNDKL